MLKQNTKCRQELFVRLKSYLFIFLGAVISCSTIKSDVYQISSVGLIRKHHNVTTIEIDVKYEDGILGLNEFSHVLVCYWLHKNDNPETREILQVYPRGNPQNPLHGVFATRSPVRPNLIGLSICKILSIEDNIIQIDTIDAYDGSPVIDLKPYIPDIDSEEDVQVPEWVYR